MNPNSFKLYKSICSAVTSAGLTFTNFTNKTFIGRSVQYVDHLIYTKAPRLSYIEHYAPVYTPKRVTYAAPICLALAGTVLLAEIAWTNNAKEQANNYFIATRE
ncbi:unnamed protein product [Paramecium sonneborni]|uniref:Uncharacterized protein n=1 Tax=Paramecium sonneborni TaxID=65129 RepID=A0A8S1LG38_9CILI|nr:unnamed protein product [Paramecium sonneborni]